MDDGLDIPEFLRLSKETRAEAWIRKPPKAMPGFGRTFSETERAYRASIEHDKARARVIAEQRWAELRERQQEEKAARERVALAVKRRNKR